MDLSKRAPSTVRMIVFQTNVRHSDSTEMQTK